MIQLLTLWASVLATAPANTANYESGPLRVEVNIRSSVFTYTLTNTESDPVVKVIIPEQAAYNFQGPEGWEKKTAGQLFEAWAIERSRQITRGQSGDFSLRVSSRGAVLGQGAIRVSLESGREIVLHDVWVPATEPASYQWLLVVMLVSILLYQTFRVIRKKGGSRRARVVPSGKVLLKQENQSLPQ